MNQNDIWVVLDSLIIRRNKGKSLQWLKHSNNNSNNSNSNMVLLFMLCMLDLDMTSDDISDQMAIELLGMINKYWASQ